MTANRSSRRSGRRFDAVSEKVSRRVVLASAAGAGAAAAAATLKPGASTAEPSAPAPSDDPRKLSYRETDHIRWFYARSRF